MMPKVSLILTTYNCKANFKRTMESIARQDYPDIEVVIKDGQSTDGTLELIQEYGTHFKYPVKWKSEADTGIYDAINQGYELTTGKIIAVFNDLYERTDAVSLLVAAIESEKADGAHADLIYATDTQIKRYWHMGQGKISQGWMPGHPTLYLKREVYEKYGLYDTSYTCSADYEFMIRILKNGDVRLAYVPEILIRMFYGGTSNASKMAYWVSVREGHRALRQNRIPFAWLLIMKRTRLVLKQFKSAERMAIKSEKQE